jgi:hypothetical protein
LQKLLSFFGKDLKDIVQKFLLRTDVDGDVVLLEVLKDCYKQSSTLAGSMHSQHYFIEIGEAKIGSPFDPDYQSEQSYAHEE